MKKHKWLKWLLIVFGVIILAMACFMFRPDTYFPHKRIVLQAPYDMNFPPERLMPMGEKIEHPNAPLGHPGIDLQWNHQNARILSASNGKITHIKQTPEHYNNWDIEVSSWPYIVRYKELQDYDTTLKVGSSIRAGQYLGRPGWFSNHAQMHWEFGSPSPIRDRFCPMTYFEPNTAKQLEESWTKTTWQYKAEYPEICSGGYKNKIE